MGSLDVFNAHWDHEPDRRNGLLPLLLWRGPGRGGRFLELGAFLVFGIWFLVFAQRFMERTGLCGYTTMFPENARSFTRYK
jgi:hypothetical protein